MENQFEAKRTRRYIMMRMIMDFGMGFLYMAIGLFMMFPEKVGFQMETFDPIFRYLFGGLCVLYGAWRIYRGIKKDYF